MRSELVFGAIRENPNRYLLVKLASKAARRLHRPNTRIQDTTNSAFVWLRRGASFKPSGSHSSADFGTAAVVPIGKRRRSASSMIATGAPPTFVPSISLADWIRERVAGVP
jgi:hypothetical protein